MTFSLSICVFFLTNYSTRECFQGKQVQAGEVVNPGDILDLNANAKELRKAHTRLKLDVEKYMGELKVVVGKMGPAFKQLKMSEKGTIEEIEEVRALYRKEALQRKLLYNQVGFFVFNLSASEPGYALPLQTV